MVPKLHIPEQFQLRFRPGWGVIQPQVTTCWARELFQVDLVDAVRQASRISPERDTGQLGTMWEMWDSGAQLAKEVYTLYIVITSCYMTMYGLYNIYTYYMC